MLSVERSSLKPVSLLALSVQARSMREELTAEAASPLGASGVGVGTPAVRVSLNQLKLATAPLEPFVSNAKRKMCFPELSWMPASVIVFQVCHPPVLGIWIVPVTLA